MTKKRRKTFTQEQKDKAVAEYISEEKTAHQLAQELDCEPQHIYRWKTLSEERSKGLRLDKLINEGNTKEMAQKLLEKELEIEMYQKKIAELTIINELLKKSRVEGISAPESELTGLIKTISKSGQKRKRVKR